MTVIQVRKPIRTLAGREAGRAKRRLWLLAGALATVPLWSFAQTTAYAVNITAIRTGWATDAFGIETTQTMVNPANCPVLDGYAAEGSVAGYKTHYAAALLAFASNKTVWVVVSNTACSQGRPMIIGVTVRAS